MKTVIHEVSKEEYLQLADKYEGNQEVMKLMVVTHHAARKIFLFRGFQMGVTVGLLAAALIVGIVSIICN